MKLQEHLRRQLDFIRSSCVSFDQGYADESIRVAVCLRVLFHDTKLQTSLLTQMKARSVRILSTVPRVGPGAVLFSGMLRLVLPSGGVPKVSIALGDAPHKEMLSRDEWWDQVISVDARGSIRRKNVALCAADRDGGAHVDPRLTTEYKTLQDGFWKIVTRDPYTEVSVPDSHFVVLRQMGYEVLNSPDLVALAG